MLKTTSIYKVFLALAAVLALSGCLRFPPAQTLPARTEAPAASATLTPAASPTSAADLPAQLQALLQARADGVNSKDQALYLSTVLPSDAVLLKEETNLIRAAAGLAITGYSLTASSLEKTNNGYTALLDQSYTLDGQPHACRYKAAFETENGKLYYRGPAFEVMENEHVRVHYTEENKGLAAELLQIETDVLGRMRQRLGFTPAGHISVKLFDDQSVFLQSVKLDLPEWVGGWHEYGEAVKSFTGAYGKNAGPYRRMLNHESTHRMVSELSNDNASYWLQEGLAGVFEDWLDAPGETYLPPEEAKFPFTPFAEHKTINLEKIGMDDMGAVMAYYSSSKAYAAYLLEQFGWDKMKQALKYMQKFELIPVTGAEKISDTNSRTDEAVRSVFGFKNDAEFQSRFEKWLETKVT